MQQCCPTSTRPRFAGAYATSPTRMGHKCNFPNTSILDRSARGYHDGANWEWKLRESGRMRSAYLTVYFLGRLASLSEGLPSEPACSLQNESIKASSAP